MTPMSKYAEYSDKTIAHQCLTKLRFGFITYTVYNHSGEVHNGPALVVASLLEMDKVWSWNAKQCKQPRENRAISHHSLTPLFQTVWNDRACRYRQIIMSNDTFFLLWQLSEERLHKATGSPEWRRSSSISLDLCAIMQCELISASNRCMQRCPHPMHVLSDVSRYTHGDSNRTDESEQSVRARCEMKRR